MDIQRLAIRLTAVLLLAAAAVCFAVIGSSPGGFVGWWDTVRDETRTARLGYLKGHMPEYDSYIIGSAAADGLPAGRLGEYLSAGVYNMAEDSADMAAVEQTCRWLIDNCTVKRVVLMVSLENGCSRPSAAVGTAADRLADAAEPVGSMEDYLTAHPAFAAGAGESRPLDRVKTCMESVAAIRDMCAAAGAELTVVASPMYIGRFSEFDRSGAEEFYAALAEITPFWDFSVSSVSCDPRYFRNETSFRDDVGRMMLARMFGDGSVYLPEDFGVYVTPDNAAEALAARRPAAPLPEEDCTADVPVLMYHHLAATGNDSMRVSTARFEEQMRALREAGYTPVSFAELEAYVTQGAPLPDRPVCITFDDGYLSNYELAFPILKKYDMKATIFVIGVSVGRDRYKDTGHEMTPHFSWKQAEEMADSGLISIQSHTWDMHQWAPFEDGNDSPQENILRHEDVEEADYVQALARDCETMAEQFSAHLGYTPTVLAYPGGYYDALSQAVLSGNGYAVTLSTRHGSNTVVRGLAQSLYAMKRFTMNDAVTVETLLDWVASARG